MSWRQRTGGATVIRARQANRPVYEDFQPQIDTNEEEGARVVVLQVPGFLKEQMKITSEQGTNIRVHGQRPLLENRWSRFNVLLPIPQNCDPHKIHAKFQNGILTISMPKGEVTRTTLLPPVGEKTAEKTTRDPPKATESKVVPPPVSEPNQKATGTGESSAKKGPEKAPQTAAKDEKQKGERGAPTIIEKIPQKTAVEAQKVGNRPGETADRDEKPRGVQKIGQEQKDEKIREISGKTRVLDSDDPLKVSSEKIQPKAQTGQEAISSRQSNADRKNAKETLKEPENRDKVVEKSSEKGKESTQKGNESAGAPPTDAAAVLKNLNDVQKAVEEKLASVAANQVGEASNGNKLGIKDIAVTAKQTFTSVVKKLNEDDRQLLINIGAAVLVLVALGAYVSFGNFGSSADNEN